MKKLPHASILIATLLSASPAAAADWQIRTTGDVALEIAYRQAPVLKANYCFWAENW